MTKNQIDLGYNAEHYPEADNKITRVVEQFGGERISGGMGFGTRDMQFEFKDETTAYECLKALRATFPNQTDIEYMDLAEGY